MNDGRNFYRAPSMTQKQYAHHVYAIALFVQQIEHGRAFPAEDSELPELPLHFQVDYDAPLTPREIEIRQGARLRWNRHVEVMKCQEKKWEREQFLKRLEKQMLQRLAQERRALQQDARRRLAQLRQEERKKQRGERYELKLAMRQKLWKREQQRRRVKQQRQERKMLLAQEQARQMALANCVALKRLIQSAGRRAGITYCPPPEV